VSRRLRLLPMQRTKQTLGNVVGLAVRQYFREIGVNSEVSGTARQPQRCLAMPGQFGVLDRGDPLIACELTGSRACVRTTIRDGLADGFRTIAVRECIGDRVPSPSPGICTTSTPNSQTSAASTSASIIWKPSIRNAWPRNEISLLQLIFSVTGRGESMTPKPARAARTWSAKARWKHHPLDRACCRAALPRNLSCANPRPLKNAWRPTG
jgi:hypothetical protein